MKTKSAYVRYSGALAVALLAFSFNLGNLGTTNAVRADELVELTPAMEAVVLNLGLSAAAESEAISACTAEVVAEFCECPVTVVQTAAEPSEAKDDTPVIEAAAEVDAAPPGSEAAAEPEKTEAAVETIPSEATAEPVEAAATETEPTLTIAAAAEPAADSDEADYAGSLPNTGAAIIWYPEVEVFLP